MFGKNTITGKKFFKETAGDKLYVTSLFMTLQGEGPFRGMPAFFIRLAKCNLACSFCDTYFDSGDWYTIEELIEKVNTEINLYFKNDVPEWAQTYVTGDNVTKPRDMALVITGGEPMLQDNLMPFLRAIEDTFKYTQIESNGTQYQPLPASTTLVISPKCNEIQGQAIRYLKPREDVLERADCLKFVMCADEKSPYSTIPEWAHEWKARTGRDIFISPMNIYNDEPRKSKELRSTKNSTTIEERSTVDEVISAWEHGLLNPEENRKNHRHAANYCIKHGLIFQMQIHLYAELA